MATINTSTAAPITTATVAAAMAMPMPSDSNSTASGEILMGMSAMSMTFFHSAATPLFWDWWKPSGPGQYAATCLFLVALAAVTRTLFAVRRSPHARRRPGRIRYGTARTSGSASDATEGLLPADHGKTRGLAEGDGPDPEAASVARRFASRWWGGGTLGERLWRSCCEAVLVCLGYFLMLAVMTMNTGYFLSVIAGVALSMFLLGNSADDGAASDPWHQC